MIVVLKVCTVTNHVPTVGVGHISFNYIQDVHTYVLNKMMYVLKVQRLGVKCKNVKRGWIQNIITWSELQIHTYKALDTLQKRICALKYINKMNTQE